MIETSLTHNDKTKEHSKQIIKVHTD